MQDDFDLLSAMLMDAGRQSSLHTPGPYWAAYAERVAAALRQRGIAAFRNDAAISKGYADCLPVDPSELWPVQSWKTTVRKLIWHSPVVGRLIREQRQVAKNYRDSALAYKSLYYQEKLGPWAAERGQDYVWPDSEVGGTPDVVTINGQRVAASYLRHLVRLDAFAQQVDFTNVASMFEIGGGFGANIHILVENFAKIRKIYYLDIPPILYVGTQYLRHFYPDAVRDYRETREAKEISFANDDRLEIIAVAPWQLDRLAGSVDLVWNSASFQEMTRAQVENYAKGIERLVVKDRQAALCLQTYAGARTGKTLTGEVIEACFTPAFQFIDIPPIHHFESHHRYRVGRPAALAAGGQAA